MGKMNPMLVDVASICWCFLVENERQNKSKQEPTLLLKLLLVGTKIE